MYCSLISFVHSDKLHLFVASAARVILPHIYPELTTLLCGRNFPGAIIMLFGHARIIMKVKIVL
jgi:hypothetical protein